MLHASAAPTPCCLKNCDQDAAGQKWESIQSGYGLGKGQVQQDGRARSHLQKTCSKVHECPGPKEMERGPKESVFQEFLEKFKKVVKSPVPNWS